MSADGPIFGKFIVRRTDGTDAVGLKHDGCDYFVLDLDHDPAAKPAVLAYANAVEATHPVLAADIRGRWALHDAGFGIDHASELDGFTTEHVYVGHQNGPGQDYWYLSDPGQDYSTPTWPTREAMLTDLRRIIGGQR